MLVYEELDARLVEVYNAPVCRVNLRDVSHDEDQC